MLGSAWKQHHEEILVDGGNESKGLLLWKTTTTRHGCWYLAMRK